MRRYVLFDKYPKNIQPIKKIYKKKILQKYQKISNNQKISKISKNFQKSKISKISKNFQKYQNKNFRQCHVSRLIPLTSNSCLCHDMYSFNRTMYLCHTCIILNICCVITYVTIYLYIKYSSYICSCLTPCTSVIYIFYCYQCHVSRLAPLTSHSCLCHDMYSFNLTMYLYHTYVCPVSCGKYNVCLHP